MPPGLDVEIPSVDALDPLPVATGFDPRQAFQFVIFGEKASLEDVALPAAEDYEADLYLQTGEISDTHVYRIAKDAAADNRPLVVFILADCDPAGYQMAVSIARKLQALRDLFFRRLKFEVVPVALTVEQVRELGLPSTPLKETEKRADRWRDAFGVEQTEIDALLVLQPDTLREIIDRAFDPYFDRTLTARVERAHATWRRRATQEMNAQIDQARLAVVRAQAAERLAEMEATIDDINSQLRSIAPDDLPLPPIKVPEPRIDAERPRPALVKFDDDWMAATRAMKDRKAYGNGGDE